MPARPGASPGLPAGATLARLVGLFGFAVSVPLLDLLARHPEHLLAHQVVGARAVLFAAALLLGVPAGLGLLLWALARLATALARAALHLLVALLLAASAALPLARALPDGGLVPLLLGGVLGGAGALAFARSAAVRRLVGLSCLVVPVFAVTLFTGDGFASLVRAGGESAATRSAFASGSEPPPVIVVVFDELPLVSLLDPQHEIDAARYPNFAAFAEQATWYTDVAAAGCWSHHALPALVTGRQPRILRKATSADYPENLFTLLAPSHDVHAVEYFSLAGASARRPEQSDAGDVLSDLSILYGHLLLPESLAAATLPRVDQELRNFARPAARAGGGRGGRALRFGDKVTRLRRVLASMEPCERPCAWFLHWMLPHPPWEFTAGARRYRGAAFQPSMDRRSLGRWPAGRHWLTEGYQRHLFQVAAVDRLLGELLRRLRELSLYDRALVVVASDHGASFWPRQPRRELTSQHRHPEDILRIPLFVKAPGQTEGRRVERRLSAIDLLPTVADVLGVEVPWAMEGVSALAPEAPEPRKRRALGGELGFEISWHGELDLGASVRRKHALFPHREGAFFAFGPHRGLLGQAVEALPGAPGRGLRFAVPESVFAGDARIPLRVIGFVRGVDPPSGPLNIAAAVDGVIRSVGQAVRSRDGRWVFSLFLPDEVRARPREALALLLVEGEPAAPRLRPGAVRQQILLTALRQTRFGF